jgi:hypothetical protein
MSYLNLEEETGSLNSADGDVKQFMMLFCHEAPSAL